MCIWALREFAEFIWADWDTLMVKEPQDDFYEYCREHQTPKFMLIKHYGRQLTVESTMLPTHGSIGWLLDWRRTCRNQTMNFAGPPYFQKMSSMIPVSGGGSCY